MPNNYLFVSGGTKTTGTITLSGSHYTWTVCGICGESLTKRGALDAMRSAWKQHDDNN